MIKEFPYFSILIIIFNACSVDEEKDTLSNIVLDSPSIEGKKEYLDSPFLTTGNRVYMVGHQNGNFPALGWHIKGEMGGIWNHLIKLMDGFDAALKLNETTTLALDINEKDITFSSSKKSIVINIPLQ